MIRQFLLLKHSMCVHTLLIYDNKSLASHINECDFIQQFLLNQPIHEKSFLY
jgi:hypothetical protein